MMLSEKHAIIWLLTVLPCIDVVHGFNQGGGAMVMVRKNNSRIRWQSDKLFLTKIVRC